MSAAIAPLAAQQHAALINNLKKLFTCDSHSLDGIHTIENSFNLKFLLRRRGFRRRTRKVTDL
jgi:hypothetical protein